MAKARSRAAARKVKDKWKAKSWYEVIAPPSFDSVTIASTLCDDPNKLINRVTAVSLQDLSNDFRKSHIKLFFKINKVEETTAHAQFAGHTLTSDYIRRMIRRKKSKIDGVYDAETRDGATVRVKPFATTEKRVQSSQKKVIREIMKKTIQDQAKKSTFSEFVNNIINGKIGSEIYKGCKKVYPVKRVEVYKTEVVSYPSIMIEEEPKKKEELVKESKDTKKKEKKTTKTKEKETEEVKEPGNEEKLEESKEETLEEKKEEVKETDVGKEVRGKKLKKPKKEIKPKAKKAPAKKTVAKKTTTKKTTKAKMTTKKKTATKKKTTTKKKE